jgi:hypothetical protein
MGPAKTRHQKVASETRGRNGASVAQFPTRRPSRIREMPRYRAVLKGLGMLAGGDHWRTEWDSNPRYGFVSRNTLSKRAPSATRPSLQMRCRGNIAGTAAGARMCGPILALPAWARKRDKSSTPSDGQARFHAGRRAARYDQARGYRPRPIPRFGFDAHRRRETGRRCWGLELGAPCLS